MSARIFAFPLPTELLQLEGCTLIAWSMDSTGWMHAMWKPVDGKGWYRVGWLAPGRGIRHERVSRKVAREGWGDPVYREPYNWHYLCTEAQAFPQRRRQYMRPPRIPLKARGRAES
jgi:hypothetical protein